jgi:hypothetical protein
MCVWGETIHFFFLSQLRKKKLQLRIAGKKNLFDPAVVPIDAIAAVIPCASV